ncbi:exosome complex component rrp45 [Drechslerella stenobrocha 248]|uniref:Exosome complex component RRP45 n=1 Tax=Drechslerella stenobrocha 248 TaxID=1043628 RepID=W7HN14_9PEZI|nr:exosome complex component rrp45 [Drechslerella stenobrocha 248]
MPKDPEISLTEKTFVLEALKQNLRIDGRDLHSSRDVQLTFGDDYGFVDVRLGKTRVLARISAEVTKPRADRPFEGLFTISTEMGPMASPVFEAGRPTDLDHTLSRTLEKSIRRSQALDTESLCLVTAQRVWSIRADVHFLTHDGNLLDAACIALVTALAHFRLPVVSVSGEDITIHSPEERVPVPLSLLHWPLCVSFSFFGDDDAGEMIFLVDATAQEEALRSGDMSVTVNKNGEICQMAKSGGVAVEAEVLLRCARMAAEKAKVLDKMITEALRDDELRRNKGNLDWLKESRAENDR